MPPQDDVITKNRPMALALIGLIIILLGGFVLWDRRDSPYLSGFLGTNTAQNDLAPSAQQQVGSATYTCDNGRSITATFFDLKNPPAAPSAPGAMPTPTGSVSLMLSDGRTMTLPQTLSASGIRYANKDETFIFWSKGNTAFIEEGPKQIQTYQGCITGTPEQAASSTAPAPAAQPQDTNMPDSGVLY